MDKVTWAAGRAEKEVVKVVEVMVYVLHDLYMLDIDPVAAGFNAVISGHTLKPSLFNPKGVLFLNPGSATLPKSAYMDSAALLHIHRNSLNAEIIEL